LDIQIGNFQKDWRVKLQQEDLALLWIYKIGCPGRFQEVWVKEGKAFINWLGGKQFPGGDWFYTGWFKEPKENLNQLNLGRFKKGLV